MVVIIVKQKLETQNSGLKNRATAICDFVGRDEKSCVLDVCVSARGSEKAKRSNERTSLKKLCEWKCNGWLRAYLVVIT